MMARVNSGLSQRRDPTCASYKLWCDSPSATNSTTNQRTSPPQGETLQILTVHFPRNTIIKMLRLCPGDNLGQSKWLGSILIRTGRVADTLSFAQEWLHPAKTDKDNIPIRGGTRFLPPSQEPLPDSTEQRLTEFCQDAIIYTAALSSFTLWGKCPLSNQYLRIAAKINPTILMRILGRVRQPSAYP